MPTNKRPYTESRRLRFLKHFAKKAATMKSQIRYLFMTSLVFAVTGISASAVAADKPERVPAKAPQSQSRNIEFENDLVKMIVIPRTREQMKAFYEGRGFPPSAIAAIAEACFMTVIVKNKSDKILWLELENWRFSSTAADVRRLDRGYWKQRPFSGKH